MLRRCWISSELARVVQTRRRIWAHFWRYESWASLIYCRVYLSSTQRIYQTSHLVTMSYNTTISHVNKSRDDIVAHFLMVQTAARNLRWIHSASWKIQFSPEVAAHEAEIAADRRCRSRNSHQLLMSAVYLMMSLIVHMWGTRLSYLANHFLFLSQMMWSNI